MTTASITGTSSVSNVGTTTPTIPVVTSFNTRTGDIALTTADVTAALGFAPANLVSPVFTGTPAAPMRAVTDSTTSLATTAYVQNVVAQKTSRLPAATKANTTDLIAATQGSTGAGTGTSRALTYAQMLQPNANYSAISPNLTKVTYTIDTGLVDSSCNPTINVTNIHASANSHQLWTNFDTVNWNVAGGDNSPGAVVVARYCQLIRSTPTPGSTGWAMIGSVVDNTNLPSSTAGNILMLELDMQCNDVDDAHSRQGIVIVLAKQNGAGADPHAESAILIQGPPAGSWRAPLIFNCRFGDAIIDMKSSVHDGSGGGTGLWLGDDHSIQFDTLGLYSVQYVSADSTLRTFGPMDFHDQVTLNSIKTNNVPVTTTATGGAATLPGNPQGFLTINVQGTDRKIPFYNV